MSLDLFWSLPSDSLPPTFDPPLLIDSSSYTKDASAFKGTRYSTFLENEFSLTLFRKKISPEEIKTLSKKLKNFVETNEKKKHTWSVHLSNKDIIHFSRMLSAYADLNASLSGWW
jgi:hypothetical protein